MAIDVSNYNRIISSLGIDNNDFNIQRIATTIPVPTVDDYNIGYIQRYFIQKRNDVDSYIYETTKQTYTDISTNPFYIGVILRWKISGDREEVRIMNQKSVSYASNTIQRISLYLPNYLQFHKERV